MKKRAKTKRVLRSVGQSSMMILAAAAASLPIALPAMAEAAPENASISYKYLDYQDSQPDADRIRVKAHAFSLTVPLDGVWSFSGTVIKDAISGASPRYHSSGITPMHDSRNAVSGSVTRYFSDSTYTFGASYSGESDYISRGVSFQGTKLSEDKNTTWTYGIGYSSDSINAFTMDAPDTKKVIDVIGGVTQVLSPVDIAQVTLRYSNGHGYFSDPYKSLDVRPRDREIFSLLGRWNHHFADSNSTLRSSYRYYTDSFKIKAHTLGLEYVKSLPGGWTITPQIRYHDQSAASFYFEVDPSVLAPFPGLPNVDMAAAVAAGGYASADQRLSAFGAVTLGLKVSKQIGRDWLFDAKYERYEQRGEWKLLGKGSTGLAPFRADSVQVGVTYLFK